MNNLYWKRVAITAAALILGMQTAGCGKTEELTTASKEFVYVPEYHEVKLEEGMNNANVIGDSVYFLTGTYDETSGSYKQYLGSLKVGSKEPELMELPFDENSSLSGISPDMDGNLIGIVNTSIYEETETAGDAEPTDEESAGALDKNTEDKQQEEEKSGEASEANTEEDTKADTGEDKEADVKADAEENLEEADTGDGTEEADTEGSTKEVSGSSSTTIIGGTGGVAMQASLAAAVSPDDQYQMPVSRKMELYKFSTTGEVLSVTDITEAFPDTETYVQYVETDKDGNIYLGSDVTVMILNKEGKKQFDIPLDNWINDMFSTKDGEVYISYYGSENVELHKIDVAAKQVGEALENISSQWGNYIFTRGTDTDLLYSVENELYTFNFGDEEPKELLNWIDCDIDSDNIRSFTALEDGRILVITTSWNSEGDTSVTELIYLTKKKGSEVPEKKILTLGTLSLGYDVRKQIISFNKKNQEYRIEIKEYFTDYSSDNAYTQAVEQMNTDIVGGNGPDIIDVSMGSNMDRYTSKGILEDIYPYIDADEQLNREDFLPNVMKAYERDGKLYTMPASFYINTSLAKTADVGERTSITLGDLMDIMDKLPEGTLLYEYATNGSVLRTNLMMNMDEYVNWDTGECKFNSESFIKALEFANRFDTEYDFTSERPGTATLIRDGKLLIMETGIGSVQEYQSYSAMFGEPVSFVGYPTTKDNGSFISARGSLLAMNAKSDFKDGVWQFIRTGLTKEEQEKVGKSGGSGFPVMKSALEEQFKKDMTDEFYVDMEGNKQRQPKTTWGFDDFSVEIYAATEEEIQTVRELIENVNTIYSFDEQISNIIGEEAQGYFEGQKAAKDVADIIQSRIQIYVNENR